MSAHDFGPGESELSSLKSTDAESLLNNTRVRYNAGHIYTRSGRLLLAVNPYRQLPLYTPDILATYRASLQPQAELPPHVFAVASSAHMGMLQNLKSQSVVISGESGAGKTETAKILLQYLAEVSASGSDLHKRVLQTNPIMESFGCAKTVWNNNSSRFGKFLTLQFSASGRMQGAYMKTYLLEKSRICQGSKGEQNYHVLYQVAKDLDAASKKEWQMGEVDTFKYLNIDKANPPVWSQLPCTFDELLAAMNTIPSVAEIAQSCWKVLAAILHLGNAEFKGANDDDAEFANMTSIGAAASLLGCETPHLVKALCTLNIKAGFEFISKPNTTSYSKSAKDALSKALYSRLFDFIVEAVNKSLMSADDTRYFIGAVDIFGFECFPNNSLEQLCINFANEKLQRIFTEAVFESVLAEYTAEGIDIGGMEFDDNSAVVDLIDGQPSGCLTLLAEECFFPNGSDHGWLEKIKQAHRPNSCFKEDLKDKESFTLTHFPGKVTYNSRGFLEKNKDPLSQDVIVLMQYSDDPFVVKLFTEKPTEGALGRRQFKSAKFVGVIDAFRTSLAQLMNTLKETKTHFIRCVKPNVKKEPKNFVDDVMLRQLYSSGVIQAVIATRKGFPDHLPFGDLLSRFKLVLPGNSSTKTGKEGCTDLLALAKVEPSQYRIGKTKVFLGVGVLDNLEKLRMVYLATKALHLQSIARMYLAKKELKYRRDERERKRKAEEEKRRREQEEIEKKAAEERAKKDKEESAKREVEAKQKEAEEKDRQERFRRARQLSFERKTARKKREEKEKGDDSAEKKKAEEEAAKKAADGESQQPSEEYAKKLEAFKNDFAEGNVTDADMMNVAVVSDIGWKRASASELDQEEVWAQYDFKCAVSDVLEYAEYLGMDIKEDAHLLWIADEALQAPEPQGWEQRLDPKGGVYYYHPTTGMSLNQHPLDHHYQQFYLQMKAQYDAMYQGNLKTSVPNTPITQEESQPTPSAAVSGTPQSTEVGKEKQKKGMFGFLRPSSAKSGGAVEELYQLQVDLQRQQDGLGIGLTLDNIIVEVEPGGAVHAQGELQYGDQITSVDGSSLQGRMLKDVIVPKRFHKLVVRYTRMSNEPASPRRVRAKRVEVQTGAAPRRIEELDIMIEREKATGRLGFGIDAMNTVVEVDPKGPVAGKLKVGDKIVAVDDALLNFKKFIEIVGPGDTHKLRVARLRAATTSESQPGNRQSQRERVFSMSKKQKRKSAAKSDRASSSQSADRQELMPPSTPTMPALREVKLVKESEETKIGAVFHRNDDAFDKSFFNVEGSSVQPIIKKVDPGSMAEVAGLVPGDIVLSVNGISGLSNFQVVEMLRKGAGTFNLVVISGRQVQQSLNNAGR